MAWRLAGQRPQFVPLDKPLNHGAFFQRTVGGGADDLHRFGRVVIDDGEVFEKLAVEPGLGGNPQSAVPEFAELDVAGASLGQRDRSLERTLEQRADVR